MKKYSTFLMLILQTLICLLVLTILFTIPHLLSTVFPDVVNESTGVPFFCTVFFHITLIVYFYVSKKYSLFALPLSHLVFPAIYYIIMLILWKHSSLWKAFEAPWEAYVSLFAVFYFLPISLITFIISLIIKLIKK
ncbi:MAG: hypothetical protein LBC71_03295 [Oscillospiraceae bacterium]|jgi:hypothetical protein|nr:hypothetical protein [Oscillospiraceae bacterium]